MGEKCSNSEDMERGRKRWGELGFQIQAHATGVVVGFAAVAIARGTRHVLNLLLALVV
jgi:hypothetical protein